MMNKREAELAARMLALSQELSSSDAVQARRTGERIEAILRDLLYEHDPWSDALSARSEHPLPLPLVTEENRGHWDAARKHELRLQRCEACGVVRFPIASSCPQCLSSRAEWARLSGRGKVGSWVVFHKAYWHGMKDKLPYIVAQIELDEGPRYTSNLVGMEDRAPVVGMPVEVVFDDVTGDVTLPKFRPAAA